MNQPFMTENEENYPGEAEVLGHVARGRRIAAEMRRQGLPLGPVYSQDENYPGEAEQNYYESLSRNAPRWRQTERLP